MKRIGARKGTFNANKYLFAYYFFAILPTLGLGLLNLTDHYKKAIWVWDVIVIIVFLIINIIYTKKIDKRSLKLAVPFFLVMFIQCIIYVFALSNGHVDPLYIALPLIYSIHFINIFCLLQNQENKEYEPLLFFKYFVLFASLACIYNILKNFGVMTNINNITNKYINISSFFTQRNAFGQLLYLAVFSNIYIINRIKDKKYYFTLVLILLNLILSFSRTSIFSTIIFLFLFYGKKYINLKHKKNLILLLLIITILVIALLLISHNPHLKGLIDNFILRKEDGLTGRDTLWASALNMLTGVGFIFGYGLGSSNIIMSKYGLTNSHNTIIELLLTGGIILLCLYLIIYIHIVKRILGTEDNLFKNAYSSFLISFIAYSFFEKIIIFSTGYASVAFTIFVAAIPLLSSIHPHHKETNLLNPPEPLMINERKG